jgi:hypothetical protein
MVYKEHYVELFINGRQVEIKNQNSLNLRINNVIFNPTKTFTNQAEYSFSFNIPSTPTNDEILEYANVLSKTNKFHTRYSAEVYADGTLIFVGSLTIKGYNSEDKEYECNLVNIKVNSLEEIFGDAVLSDIPWEVEFNGVSTINQVNADSSTDYFFPLVSYGVFQKDYVSKDEVSATYTSKFDIDKYNKWWLDSFYPSLKVVETMKRAFEWKGYNVGGNIFHDPQLNSIYASCNLSNEQIPMYNLGNPLFGKLNLTTTISTTNNSSYNQDLTFPYYRVQGAVNAGIGANDIEYNWDAINWWNMLGSGTTLLSDSYMYDPGEKLIVIPYSGWYKITMSANCTLSGQGTTFKAYQWYNTFYQGDEFRKQEMDLIRGLSEITPVEIQLIKNYDSDIELIKGRKNRRYATGNPYQTEYHYEGGTYTSSTAPNVSEWETDFPHQALFGAQSPTRTDSIVVSTTSSVRGGVFSRGSGTVNSTQNTENAGGNRRAGSFGNGDYMNGDSGSGSRPDGRTYSVNTSGYMHQYGQVMPYDQAVSEGFICGFSSLYGGTVAVQRNGYSWSRMSSTQNKIFANVKGMDMVKISGNTSITEPTEYCKNSYANAPTSYCTATESTLNGYVTCCVWLERNDIIEPVLIQRDYEGQKYDVNASLSLTIEAISERSYAELKSDSSFGYTTQTELPTLLNLTNFANNETKVSDWIENIRKAFNLVIYQNGPFIDISTNQGIKKNLNYAVDIDDRVNSNEAESEYISYPKSMAVKYKIDVDEWGFEKTVPNNHINDADWKEWGDSGYTVIQLSDDTYETSEQTTQTQFSYTYYDNFNWKEVDSGGTEVSANTKTIRIPVIEKSQYMADGYGYDEAMKHDGFSFTQRFWYRQAPSTEYVWSADNMHQKIYLTYPKNYIDDFNLSYKNNEKSILTEYFNCVPLLASNYVKVDAYLSPQEYMSIKNGAMVKFDSDLHYISEISGYDCTGQNPTELKLIKKI